MNTKLTTRNLRLSRYRARRYGFWHRRWSALQRTRIDAITGKSSVRQRDDDLIYTPSGLIRVPRYRTVPTAS